MGRMERNGRMRSMGRVLPVFVGNAKVVETDGVRPPRLVQLLIEGDEVDAAIPHVTGNVPRVEALRKLDVRTAAHTPAGQPRNDLAEHGIEVATHDGVIVLHPVTELTGDVAVLLGPSREVPNLS